MPTFEQKQLYTNVLRAIIRLSTLVFPENLRPAEVDALARYIEYVMEPLHFNDMIPSFQKLCMGFAQ